MEHDHPIQAPDQLRLYKSMGEIAYSRMRGEKALAAIRADPVHFARNTLRRLFFFWAGVPHPDSKTPWVEYARSLNFIFGSVCGLLGLALALAAEGSSRGVVRVGFPAPAAGVLRRGCARPFSSPIGTVDGGARGLPLPIRRVDQSRWKP